MKLLQRLIASAVCISIFVGLLFFCPPVWFCLFVVILIGLALFEFFTMLRHHSAPSYRLFGVAIGTLIPLVVYMEQGVTRSGEVLFIILASIFLFLLQFSRKNNVDALVGISLTLFGILYVSWFASFVIKLRFLPGGVIWVAYLVAVTKAADMGAYAFGSLFGRHPLIPHISPKKSVEGFFGGLFLSTAVSAALGPYLPIYFKLPHLMVLGVLIGMVGQIGDLSESLMKRYCETKDSGVLLPGIGGVMDLTDSILFTAPIFYFHLALFL